MPRLVHGFTVEVAPADFAGGKIDRAKMLKKLQRLSASKSWLKLDAAVKIAEDLHNKKGEPNVDVSTEVYPQYDKMNDARKNETRVVFVERRVVPISSPRSPVVRA